MCPNTLDIRKDAHALEHLLFKYILEPTPLPPSKDNLHINGGCHHVIGAASVGSEPSNWS